MATIDPETGEVIGVDYDPKLGAQAYGAGAASGALKTAGLAGSALAIPGVAPAVGGALTSAASAGAGGMFAGGAMGPLAAAAAALTPVGLGIIAGGLLLAGGAAVGGAISKRKAKKAQEVQQGNEAVADAQAKAAKIAGQKSAFNQEQAMAASQAAAQKSRRRSPSVGDQDLQDNMYTGGNSYDAWKSATYGT